MFNSELGYGVGLLWAEIGLCGIVPAVLLMGAPASATSRPCCTPGAILSCVGVTINRYVFTVQALAIPVMPFDKWYGYVPNWAEWGPSVMVVAYGFHRDLPGLPLPACVFPQEVALNAQARRPGARPGAARRGPSSPPRAASGFHVLQGPGRLAVAPLRGAAGFAPPAASAGRWARRAGLRNGQCLVTCGSSSCLRERGGPRALAQGGSRTGGGRAVDAPAPGLSGPPSFRVAGKGARHRAALGSRPGVLSAGMVSAKGNFFRPGFRSSPEGLTLCRRIR
jgi:hypothetical protein